MPSEFKYVYLLRIPISHHRSEGYSSWGPQFRAALVSQEPAKAEHGDG